MFTKHNVHYLRPIYSPKTLTFCYPMPFFRVFRVFRAWLWAKGIRWHTVHTAGSWARDTRCTRYRGERRQCACVGRVVCRTSWAAGRAGRVWQAGRAGRVWLIALFVFLDVRFANTSCVKRTLSHACKDASPRCARPAGYSRKMSICYLIR